MSVLQVGEPGSTPARWPPMSIFRNMSGPMPELKWIAWRAGIWAGWSIIKERPWGPRALARAERRFTVDSEDGEIGKEYRSWMC